jgi:hypothetical protein
MKRLHAFTVISFVLIVTAATSTHAMSGNNESGIFYHVGVDRNQLDNVGVSASDPTRAGILFTETSSMIGKEINTFDAWLFKNESPFPYEGTFDIYIRNTSDAIVTVIVEDQEIDSLDSSKLFHGGPDYYPRKTHYQFEQHLLEVGDRISLEYNSGNGQNYLGAVVDLDANNDGTTVQMFSNGVWEDHYPEAEYQGAEIAAMIGNLG